MYQSGFAPNSQWTEEFAQGHEIRDYWQRVAHKYGVYKYLRFKQSVEKAEWLPDEGKWKLTIRDLTDPSSPKVSIDVRNKCRVHIRSVLRVTATGLCGQIGYRG